MYKEASQNLKIHILNNSIDKMDAKSIKEEKAEVEIWQYIFGFTPVAVVKCAIELEIADAIESHGGAVSLPDLASAVCCSPSALGRIMRPAPRCCPVAQAAGQRLTRRGLGLQGRARGGFLGLRVPESGPEQAVRRWDSEPRHAGHFRDHRPVRRVGAHDRSDDECVHVLTKCREAVPKETGKVIIAEAVIVEGEEDKYSDVKLALDMVMMAHTEKGKERTLEEWDCVIKRAGFSSYTVKHIGSIFSIIVACP
ncbi:hypothetical protein SASPL_124643 [Salvia splendens]|uniref:O-methyltransferase domain-containing protein n=1 Tax=Salvia splendens TaxID=180675 RepID=A0A8X8ZPD5_SALSN|nr:hypothetical protein SASPL_124643 [Salvia splendens]